MSNCLTTNSLDSMSQFIEMFKGDFPIERWEECLSITNGKKYDGEYQQSGTYPICGSGGIMGYGDQKLCQGKTVILGRKGNINSPIFMESEYWIVDTAFCLEVDKQKLHPKYFYYWCKQFDFTRYNKQGVLPSLTKNDLLKIEMPIPPMELQVRFVNIIEQADKSEFVGFKSQFIEMFGKTTNRVSLSSLCDTFIDGDWIEAKDQSESGIRLIQTGNVGVGIFKDKGEKARYISEETFNRLNCTEVVEGDILISRLPDPVGRACIIPGGLGKTITAVDCTILRLKDLILPKFFIAFTNTPDYAMQIKKVLSGTTRLRVSRTNLGNIEVPLPSFEEQLRFVSIALQADKSEKCCEFRLAS